jgi:hypothetical protein
MTEAGQPVHDLIMLEHEKQKTLTSRLVWHRKKVGAE